MSIQMLSTNLLIRKERSKGKEKFIKTLLHKNNRKKEKKVKKKLNKLGKTGVITNSVVDRKLKCILILIVYKMIMSMLTVGSVKSLKC